jgi:Ca2+-binding RTX toxin-like protein
MRVSQFKTITGTADGQTLIGASERDLIYGFGSGERLYAGAGDDILYAGPGGSLLDGGPGADIMYGGLGNDVFRVENIGDVVNEQTAGGNDTVQSWITYTLPQFVVQLNLMGTAAINGTGNDLNNKLVANDAGDVLSGGAVTTL